MLKRIFHIIILILLFNIFPSHYVLHAQVIPDTARQSEEVTSPFLKDQKLPPSFSNDPVYNQILTDAMILQNVADSLGNLAFRYRQDILYMDNVYERNRLQYQLEILEDQMKSIQAEADSLFLTLPQITLQADRNSFLTLDTVINGIKVYHFRKDELSDSVNPAVTSGTGTRLKTENQTAGAGSDINIFSILPGPAYSPDHPFENDFQIPPGTFYRIQLAALSQEVSWERFGGIQPITVEKAGNGGVIRYYAGKFAGYSDAESALNRVRSSGFRDAFIVGYYNGQRMSVEQVREYEKMIH